MKMLRPLMVPVCISAAACGAASGAPPAASSAPPAASSSQPAVLDARIQRIASEELDRVVAEWKATRAVVVVLEPQTGRVLAMDGRDEGRKAAALPSERAWVTGSTFKTLTIGLALEDHTIALDQRFGCGKRTIGSEIYHDASDAPCDSLDAAGVLAKSSNVGTSYVFDTLGSRRLSSFLRALHVGDAPGNVPAIDDDKSVRAAAFANGEVAKATPLQVAAAYGAIFNAGVYVPPSFDRPAAGVRVLSEGTARALVQMLEGVVSGDGNGKGARIAGARAAGKTGTGDVDDGSGREVCYASFVGAVIDREPRFVALVGLEDPAGKASGPTAAAPAWGRLVQRILTRSQPSKDALK